MWELYVVTAELMAVTLFTIGNIFVPLQPIAQVQIVIIGAGPSGIAAATRLLENGINNFVILEAEHRIGGRVNTIQLGDGVIDLGCQWVHGEEGNVVFSMASQQNQLMNSIVGDYEEEDKIIFIDSSGTLIEKRVVETYFLILEGLTENSTTALLNFTGSLGEYYDTEYQKKLSEKGLKDPHTAKLFLNWYHRAVNSMDSADSWYETSGRGETEYHKCKGKQNWAWKSGYVTVLDLLMKKIPDASKELPIKNKTRLNTEVNRIVWDDLSQEYRNKIAVETSEGTTYIADHVIVTVSLGVLKERSHALFQPELSTKKTNAIKGLAIGTVDKIYLKFPYKWWPEHTTEFAFLWDEEIPPCKRKDCWIKDITEFHAVDNQPLLLCGWITGPAARHMEQLSDEEVIEESMKLLRKYIGAAYNISVPQPDQIIRSSWYSNLHFRGSYSFRSMETEALETSAAHLAEPITNCNGTPVLLFAGEATHSHFYSTVHGAVESGWREADRILKMYQ